MTVKKTAGECFIELPVEDAKILDRKLTAIFCASSLDQRRKWSKAWIMFCSQTRKMACVDEYKDKIGFKDDVMVTVSLEHAKILLKILKNHSQKAEALSLSAAIQRAENCQCNACTKR